MKNQFKVAYIKVIVLLLCVGFISNMNGVTALASSEQDVKYNPNELTEENKESLLQMNPNIIINPFDIINQRETVKVPCIKSDVLRWNSRNFLVFVKNVSSHPVTGIYIAVKTLYTTSDGKKREEYLQRPVGTLGPGISCSEKFNFGSYHSVQQYQIIVYGYHLIQFTYQEIEL